MSKVGMTNSGNAKRYGTYERSTFIYDSYIQTADYVEGARRVMAQARARNPGAKSLLDVGCGSGKYIEQLQRDFECEGLDLSDGFLKIARERCPEVTFHKGDMTDFSLGRKFDVITCLFLAIAYVGSRGRLERAVACMARHLNPGGILLFEPWVYPENFWDDKLTSEYVDEEDRKISRMFIQRREGALSVYDIHYLVGTPDGIEYFVEREELGLFTHENYMGSIEKAALIPDYDKSAGLFDDHNIGMYYGLKA